MLKKLFVGLVPTIIITTAGVCVLPATSATSSTIVSTPRQFCEYFNQFVTEEQFLEDCSIYPDEVGAELITDEVYNLEDKDLTLKDMNFTYSSIRSPFTLIWGGRLTIDGGTYRTESACFFSLGYNSETGSTNYDGLTIISGDFIAEGRHGELAKSPICLVPSEEANNEEAEAWLSRSLGPNSYYTEFGTEKIIETEKEIVDTIRGFGKSRDEMMKIKEFNSNKVSVRQIEPEKQTEQEEVEENIQSEVNATTEEELSESEADISLPKAPNTGVGKM